MTAKTVIHTAWVKPPTETGGLDHLGVKAPVIHIYGELLPGITNVTDRARYYSFYPWLVWHLDKAGIRDWQGEARQYVRRTDCLSTLITNYDEISHDKDGENNALGLVRNWILENGLHGLLRW